MVTFAEAGSYAEDPGFLRQVKVALMVAGGTVAIEDRDQYPDSTMFSLRKSLAINVLQDPDGWARRFASVVMYDDRVRAAAPSADVPAPAPVDDMLLAGIIYWTWNAVAGAGAALTPPPQTPVSAAPAVLEAHPIAGVARIVGAPVGEPLPLTTADDVPVRLRAPVLPPGAPDGWPGMSPWG